MKNYQDLINYLNTAQAKKFDWNSKDDMPKLPGIYFVFEKGGNDIVRVGQATNLYERIFSEHLGAGKSSFKNIFAKRKYGNKFEELNDTQKDDVKNHMINTFEFVVVLVPQTITLDEIESYYIGIVKDASIQQKYNIQSKTVNYQEYFGKFIELGLVTNSNINIVGAEVGIINKVIVKFLNNLP